MPKNPEATVPRQHPADELCDVLMSYGEVVQTQYRVIVRTFPGQHHEASLRQAIAAAVDETLAHFVDVNPDPKG